VQRSIPAFHPRKMKVGERKATAERFGRGAGIEEAETSTAS
jgi:hypothetical protein